MPPSNNPPNLFIYTPPTPLTRLARHPLLFLAHLLYKTQPPVTPPPPSNPSHPIRVVCISDTHTATPTLPRGDVLVHAGDLSDSGTRGEVQGQVDWIGGLQYGARVVVGGNHDLVLDGVCVSRHVHVSSSTGTTASAVDGEDGKENIDWGGGGTTYLVDSTARLKIPRHDRHHPLTIHGSPWTRQNGNWAFQYAPSAQFPFPAPLPQHLDILLTHSPAKGHLDGECVGSATLLRELWRVRPRLHVHGHVHVGRGREVLDFGGVQWCYDGVVGGARGWRGWGLLGVGVVVWMWVWVRFLVLGRGRVGRTVVVNAAWEGNEGRGIEVVEL